MLQKEIERLLSENNPAALKTPTESQMKQFHAKHKQTNFSINDLKKKKKKARGKRGSLQDETTIIRFMNKD